MNVGDRVRCIKSSDKHIESLGITGTVVYADNKKLLVLFDKNIKGHNGGVRLNLPLKEGHCWYYETMSCNKYLIKIKGCVL